MYDHNETPFRKVSPGISHVARESFIYIAENNLVETAQ